MKPIILNEHKRGPKGFLNDQLKALKAKLALRRAEGVRSEVVCPVQVVSDAPERAKRFCVALNKEMLQQSFKFGYGGDPVIVQVDRVAKGKAFMKFSEGLNQSVSLAHLVQLKMNLYQLDVVLNPIDGRSLHPVIAALRAIKGDEIVVKKELAVGSRFQLTTSLQQYGSCPHDRLMVHLSAMAAKPIAHFSPVVRAFLSYVKGGVLDLGVDFVNGVLKKVGIISGLTVLWGPPGTGKSLTIASTIRDIVVAKARFLVYVVAKTNDAVANISQKLGGMGVNHWAFIKTDSRHLFVNPTVKFLDSRFFLDDDRRNSQGILNGRKGSSKLLNLMFHSTVILTTVNRLLAPRFVETTLTPGCLIFDEASTVTTYEFLATLNTNPSSLVVVGDPIQCPPYSDLGATPKATYPSIDPSDFELCNNPFNFYKLTTHSSCRVLGNGIMRPPLEYVRLFGGLFYADTGFYPLDFKLDDLDFSKMGYMILPTPQRPDVSDADERSVELGAYWLDSVAVDNSVVGIVTPFIAQAEAYRSLCLPHTVKTIRVVQGDTYNVVLLDFVKDTNYASVNNQLACVSLSRHTSLIGILGVPACHKGFLSMPFKYDDADTVAVNYARFKTNHRIAGFGVDINGHIRVMWRFFLWCLERKFFKHFKIDLTKSQFGIMETMTPDSVSNISARCLLMENDDDKMKIYTSVDPAIRKYINAGFMNKDNKDMQDQIRDRAFGRAGLPSLKGGGVRVKGGKPYSGRNKN